MDGTDFAIEEPRVNGFDPRWYSHKLNGPGVRYEIALSIEGNHIVHGHGPFPCGDYPDINIFRAQLRGMIPNGEKLIADKGYIGEGMKLWLKNEGNEVQIRAFKFMRARHETLNGRMKTFKSMDSVWRHDLDKHPVCFYSILVITQINLQYHPLFRISDEFLCSFVRN